MHCWINSLKSHAVCFHCMPRSWSTTGFYIIESFSEKERVVCNQSTSLVTATGFEPTFTLLVNEHSTIWSVWLNGWVFVYELSDCRFKSRCCHLNFRYGTCFEEGVPWNPAWIYFENRTGHDNKIQYLPRVLHVIFLYSVCLPNVIFF